MILHLRINIQILDNLWSTLQIEKVVDIVLKENPDSIKDYLNGKDKAMAFLVGKVMKKTTGKASPSIVNKLILEKIKPFKSSKI